MCLAVPGRITSIHGGTATTDMMGVEREVSLRQVPEAAIWDYILVHAGFGIQVIDEREALETIELIGDLDELVHDELDAHGAPAPAAAGTGA